MKLIPTLPAATLGLALVLAACGGEAATAESAAEDAAASEHDPAGYAEDETGGLIDAAITTELNEKLAAFHRESGADIHIVTALTTEGRDIEEVAEEMRAEREADALVLVAGQDQALAVVGEGLDEAFSDETETAMIAHFEADALAEGLNAGADALIARLGS